jgi:hypothetical protein
MPNENLVLGGSLIIGSIFAFYSSFKNYQASKESSYDQYPFDYSDISYRRLNSLGEMVLYALVMIWGISLVYDELARIYGWPILPNWF